MPLIFFFLVHVFLFKFIFEFPGNLFYHRVTWLLDIGNALLVRLEYLITLYGLVYHENPMQPEILSRLHCTALLSGYHENGATTRWRR